MNAKPEIIVVCAGGHGRVVIDVLRRAGETVVGLIDTDARLHGKNIDGVRIIGGDEAVFMRQSDGVMLVNARGNAPRTGAGGLDGRRRIYERFAGRGFKFMCVVSPDAYVSQAAVLEDGCHIITGAIVHPGTVVGLDAIINTGAQIDHDCRIGAHSHIAPGAIVCGGVTIGPECHIGAGAVITQNLTIGAGAIVAAGAVIVADVAPGTTTFGVAARSTR